MTCSLRITFIWTLLLVGGILSACKKDQPTTPAPTCEVPQPADTYTFPVRPGTPAWAALPDNAAMIRACQMPATTLASISTPGLVATCLAYPLLSDMIAYIPLQQGAQAQVANFNGFTELQQRSDGSQSLLAYYQQLDADCLPDSVTIPLGRYTLNYSFLEMVLAQPAYLQRLTTTQRHILVQETVRKYAQKKQKGSRIYGLFALKTTAFLAARVMILEGYAPLQMAMQRDSFLQAFVTSAEFQPYPASIEKVMGYAQQF